MAKPKSITFATFNLYNLNLPGVPIYTPGAALSQDEYDVKTDWIGGKIKELDADVIGFQECWDPAALADCFAKAGLLDKYDIVGRKPQKAGIQVALAARKGLIAGKGAWTESFPADVRFVDMQERYQAEEKVSISIAKFSRPPLRVVIQPPGDDPVPPAITVYVLHLKSKRPAELDYTAKPVPKIYANHAVVAGTVLSHVRRIVEAGAMRAILDTEMKKNDAPFVVIGDLNDGTLSTSTTLLTGEPGYRFFETSKAGSRSDAGLYSVEKLQQLRSFRDVYFTHVYQQNMESLDHILVSDAFYDHAITRRWSFREATILNDHLAIEDPRERTLVGANDHGLVRATFDWNPMLAALKRR